MSVSVEDLQMLTQTARSWVSENAAARPGLRRDYSISRKHWQQISEMGWAGAAIPEDDGGAGFGYRGLGALLTEVGREIADVPLLSSALFGSVVSRFGSPEIKESLLPSLMEGGAVAALALGEGPRHDVLPRLTARPNGDGWQLSGGKTWVNHAVEAQYLLVSAMADTPLLLAVESSLATCEPIESVDGRSFANISLNDVNVAASAVVARGQDAVDIVVALARIGLAAEMLGATERALEITIEYLQVREQFGKKIGSFQALQHRAAQMYVDMELARSCVGEALQAADDDSEQLTELSILAKYTAGEALHNTSNEMIQMHGGIGMTSEHVAGSYLKWSRVSEALMGGSARLADEYASLRNY